MFYIYNILIMISYSKTSELNQKLNSASLFEGRLLIFDHSDLSFNYVYMYVYIECDIKD